MLNRSWGHTVVLLGTWVAMIGGVGARVDAQPAAGSVVAIARAEAGACTIALSVRSPRAGDEVGLSVDLAEFQEKTVTANTSELGFQVGAPLRPGAQVRARINGTQVATAVVSAGSGTSSADGCAPVTTVSAPARSPFEATAYFGTIVDTFAPDSVGGYQNPEAGSSQKLRSTFGIDFDYRAIGNEDSRVQLWLKGETQHGVRTADINCEIPRNLSPEEEARVKELLPPVCPELGQSDLRHRARYILEHASSLEAFIGPRVEFLTLQRGSASPARLYVSGRFGFIALQQAPSVFKSMHLGLGVRMSDGAFKDSYFEAGWGRNELFRANTQPGDTQKFQARFKVDALLSFGLDAIPVIGEAPRFFVEMRIDNDVRRSAADSVQTLFGIDVDLKKAFGQ